jgi:hypothetical protein
MGDHPGCRNANAYQLGRRSLIDPKYDEKLQPGMSEAEAMERVSKVIQERAAKKSQDDLGTAGGADLRHTEKENDR